MIGLCCQYIKEHTTTSGDVKYVNIIDERNLQYNQFIKGKYSNKYIEEIWNHNLTNLLNILKRIKFEGINVFRVSSNLLPLHDCNEQLLLSSTSVKFLLNEIGKLIISQNMRLTTHPDQFVVISSNKKEVIDNSVKLLNHHAWIFDNMNLPITPYYAINIHGGTKGNSKTLISTIKTLSESVKGRLTLENDERSYSVTDLLQVWEDTGIPICWDSHHHTFNDGNLSSEDGLKFSMKTWGSVKPLTHLSNTEPELSNGSFLERRKHSDYVHYIPEHQKDANNNDQIDIEFEFKMKNLAIFKAITDFQIKL